MKPQLRNLLVFASVVLASGWIGRAVDVLIGRPPGPSVGILLWLIVPTLMALLLRAFAGDGWKDAGLRLELRRNIVWYVVALLLYPVLTLLMVAIGAGLGQITASGLSVRTVGQIAQTFASGVLPQLLKNVFEESAWRGYLAPRVYGLGLTGYIGHVIVGVIWDLWHVPYYLFFLERSILQQFTTLPVATFIAQAIVTMVAWAIVYGELWLLTRSIWPAVLMHTMEDAFLNQLFTGKQIAIEPGRDWLVSPVNGVISAALFLATGVALHQHRLRHRASS